MSDAGAFVLKLFLQVVGRESNLVFVPASKREQSDPSGGWVVELFAKLNLLFVEGAVEVLDPTYLKLFLDMERNLELADDL